MTPRQLAGSLEIARAEHQRALGEQLWIASLAARGKEDEVNKQLRRLSRA